MQLQQSKDSPFGDQYQLIGRQSVRGLRVGVASYLVPCMHASGQSLWLVAVRARARLILVHYVYDSARYLE